MNTPEPCDTCKWCKWDLAGEEDPDDEAWCELKFRMGNALCPEYQKHKGSEQVRL